MGRAKQGARRVFIAVEAQDVYLYVLSVLKRTRMTPRGMASASNAAAVMLLPRTSTTKAGPALPACIFGQSMG